MSRASASPVHTDAVVEYASSHLDVTAPDIAMYLDVTPKRAADILARLTDRGRLTRVGVGIYIYNSKWQAPRNQPGWEPREDSRK